MGAAVVGEAVGEMVGQVAKYSSYCMKFELVAHEAEHGSARMALVTGQMDLVTTARAMVAISPPGAAVPTSKNGCTSARSHELKQKKSASSAHAGHHAVAVD